MKTKLIALPRSGRVRRFFSKTTVLHATVMLNACSPGNSRPPQSRPEVTKITPEMGYAGVEIEISGTHLSAAGEKTRVYFGDVVTTPTVVMSGEIRVRVPQDATSGKVSVRVGTLRAEAPPFALALPDTGGWKNASAGSFHTCAVKDNGALYCWGANTSHQLGYKTTANLGLLPVQVDDKFLWDSVNGGLYIQNGNTCGLQNGGSLFCWGDNDYGQYGDGTFTNAATPQSTHSVWRETSLGAYHACGVMEDDSGYCWGRNNFGQLGSGSDIKERGSPEKVSGPTEWLPIRSGSLHSCGITTTHQLYCWGKNAKGQLGNASEEYTTVPVAVGADNDWAVVAPGSYVTNGNTCAITAAGALYCWGDNGLGQLGNGTLTDATAPTKASSSATWESISVGGTHACGIQTDGSLWCWGENDLGQSGFGEVSKNTQTVPKKVGTDHNWELVTTGAKHTCALNSGGKLFCWGDNTTSQLGVQSGFLFHAAPVAVEHSLPYAE